METFHIIDDHAVILYSKGVYRQTKLYRRENKLYAAHGAGFIQLRGDGGTSNPNISWLDTSFPYVKGNFGHPMVKNLEAVAA